MLDLDDGDEQLLQQLLAVLRVLVEQPGGALHKQALRLKRLTGGELQKLVAHLDGPLAAWFKEKIR